MAFVFINKLIEFFPDLPIFVTGDVDARGLEIIYRWKHASNYRAGTFVFENKIVWIGPYPTEVLKEDSLKNSVG